MGVWGDADGGMGQIIVLTTKHMKDTKTFVAVSIRYNHNTMQKMR